MKQSVNLVSKIKDYLQEHLSQGRYEHCLRVCCCAMEIAQSYKLDQNKVELAALLHDVTKEKPVAWHKQILNANEVTDQQLLIVVPIMHAYTGMVFASEYFGITDESILKAIEYHTIGNVTMDDIAKVVYIADYIEPGRNQDGVDEIRMLVGKIELDQIVKKIIENEMDYFNSIGKQLHPDTILLYEKIGK